MIFAHTWQQVLSGEKTQTRRLVKPGEKVLMAIPDEFSALFVDPYIQAVANANKRIKWQVGRTYAVQSGRGKRCLWWRKRIDGAMEWIEPESVERVRRLRESVVWHEARVRITDIRHEPLQDISKEDAIAEGLTWSEYGDRAGYSSDALNFVYASPQVAFAALWDSIHTKPGTRREDNPDVWVLEFELVEADE